MNLATTRGDGRVQKAEEPDEETMEVCACMLNFECYFVSFEFLNIGQRVSWWHHTLQLGSIS